MTKPSRAVRMEEPYRSRSETYDAVVVGGGLAGVCAAIAAARHGVCTALVHDRPVLGGTSSSEIRVNPRGAGYFNAWARETGIIEEIVLEDRARNHAPATNGLMNSVWDGVLYEWVVREKNLTLHLNTLITGVEMRGHRIAAVHGVQHGTEMAAAFQARYFVDATGDGTVGALAGAEYRIGREAKGEFGEPNAVPRADRSTMGSTLMFCARDVGHPVPFAPPPWAERYPCRDAFGLRKVPPISGTTYAGFLWIEVGTPFDTIDENEEIRHEALRHVYGIWDFIKNGGEFDAANFALEWVGSVPGKRESRRLIGDHILTQTEILGNTPFPDRVAYGGWFIDLHTIGGIRAKDRPAIEVGPSESDLVLCRPYSIPLRSLYSRNITNLFLAGRDISVTHCALGSTRLMMTCAVMGQAVGTAIAVAKRHRAGPRQVASRHIRELQQTLVRDDAFLLDVPSDDDQDIARRASVKATSAAPLRLDRTPSWIGLGLIRAQIFPVTCPGTRELRLAVSSALDKDVELELALAPVNDIWDFRVPDATALRAKATVRARSRRTLTFRFSADIPAPGLCQLTFPKIGSLAIAAAKPVPGVSMAWSWPGWTRWHGTKETFAIRFGAEHRPFEPGNVINGVARPERWPNLWISDPARPLPQALTLSWDTDQEIARVHLTFDTFLLTELPELPGLWRAPECVRDYRVEVRVAGRWRKVAAVTGNCQRRRVHTFDPVRTRSLRLVVTATNGAPSARVYEVRAYRQWRSL